VSDELPPGWAAASLSTIVAFNPKHDPAADRSMPVSFVPMPKVSEYSGTIEPHDSRPLESVWKGYTHFADGDVIFAKITPCMENGKAAIARGLTNGLACGSTEFHVMRPSPALLADYLWYYIRQRSFRADAEQVMSGAVGQRRVPLGFLESYPFPLPPLAEQRRIVARIEALFARTRRARADLLRITPLAERYCEQSRRRAFEAEAGWTAQGPDLPLPTYEPPQRFDGLPALSERWRWAAMSSLGTVAGGITKNQQRAAQPIQIPYLRVANVYADELRLGTIETIQVSEAERKRVMLEPGDLLIVEGNGSVEQIGRVAVWNGEIAGCGHQNHLIRVRPRDGVPSRFLVHWLMSPYGRSILEAVASSSSGLHTLSLSKVSAIPVPVPPTGTARVVAESLDSVMVAARRAKHEAIRALALLARLEQAILAQAFRGDLVPQDPRDEPAAVLLARLRGATPVAARRGRPRAGVAA
jgi:type I restriction enzyme S subunit